MLTIPNQRLAFLKMKRKVLIHSWPEQLDWLHQPWSLLCFSQLSCNQFLRLNSQYYLSDSFHMHSWDVIIKSWTRKDSQKLIRAIHVGLPHYYYEWWLICPLHLAWELRSQYLLLWSIIQNCQNGNSSNFMLKSNQRKRWIPFKRSGLPSFSWVSWLLSMMQQ